jgi:hypothetical protein
MAGVDEKWKMGPLSFPLLINISRPNLGLLEPEASPQTWERGVCSLSIFSPPFSGTSKKLYGFSLLSSNLANDN